ncbi:MAG: 4Fe-4S dicluster domain-containing protein [Proteobacteria bacterium]|nr:4Fe-4S dicluster domain-containing protein [Pseudomonadota bacterium]
MNWIDKAYGDPEYGNGRWYLNPKNHSRNMYKIKKPQQKAAAFGSDPEAQSGRKIGEIMQMRFDDPEKFRQLVKEADSLKTKGPFQIGQVIPLQEAYVVAELSYPVGSMHCICRYHARGHTERNEHEYSCTGLGVGMFKWERWPERYKGGVNFMTPDEAKEWLQKWNKKGMVHIIMTFGGSYVGGICNCDYPDCGMIRNRVDYGIETGCIKSPWVAKVDYDKCTGCGICVQRCQFGAIKFEVTKDQTNIDQFKCFGCGLCETACPTEAIELLEREELPGLKEVW